ncbi:MAG: hypothetical protein IJZ82_03665 [Lachnospiraceae bacterium]|nr:hypothetical protein [Lachnospiraceae bacterium]
MKRVIISLLALLFAGAVVWVSVWGPERWTEYTDKAILGVVHEEDAEGGNEGYRYLLSINEKVYILSKALGSQQVLESELSAKTKNVSNVVEYQELAGSYAFLESQKDSGGNRIDESEGYAAAKEGLKDLQELGILPESVKAIKDGAYDVVLYSAIDVLEPRNKVLVWKLSLSTNQQNADKKNRLLDAYIDADTGKVYEFYARTGLQWEDIDADEIAEKWSDYMGLEKPTVYENANPLSETTPYFKQYTFQGMDEANTIMTIGFYEGINELYLKISK